MKNRNLRKCAAIFALAVSAVVFLPEALFAKGAVIGYVWGSDVVSDDQLDRLTHVMVYNLFTNSNGTLIKNPGLVSNWPNNN